MSPNINKEFPKISNEEFSRRMERIKEKMDIEGIDLVVAFLNLLDSSAVRYFTDVYPINESAGLVIPLGGEPIMCSGQACHEWSRYKSKVKEISILPEVGEVSGVEYDIEGQLDFVDLFREIKSKYEIQKIGIIDDLIFPHGIYQKLERVFPEGKKESAEMLMYEMRMRISDSEIACIRKATEIITETFEYALARITPGVTEIDIPEDICKAVQVAYEGLNLVASHMNPCATSVELYNIYNEFLKDKGYLEYSPYGSMHSIGMLECEAPFFSATKEVEMEENMIVAVDAYFKDLPWGSFRIEDTFIIRESGAELVTSFNNRYISKTFM